MPPLSVVIYSKPHCGLCDEALEVLQRVKQRVDFELRVVELSCLPHAELLRYRHEIPVVFVNGQDCFHHRVDEAGLERLLLRGTPVAETEADSKRG